MGFGHVNLTCIVNRYMPVTNQQSEVFLNLSEIAHRWGLTLGAVLKYHVGDGRLTTRRHGKSHLVLVQDLAKYEKRIAADLADRIEQDTERLKRLKTPLPSLAAIQASES